MITITTITSNDEDLLNSSEQSLVAYKQELKIRVLQILFYYFEINLF